MQIKKALRELLRSPQIIVQTQSDQENAAFSSRIFYMQ